MQLHCSKGPTSVVNLSSSEDVAKNQHEDMEWNLECPACKSSVYKCSCTFKRDLGIKTWRWVGEEVATKMGVILDNSSKVLESTK